MHALPIETSEKEVQDTSCRGNWGCPPDLKIPQDWGIKGVDCDFSNTLQSDSDFEFFDGVLFEEDITIDVMPSLRMHVLSFNIIEAHIL